jgi:hypothetical protein
MRTSALVAPLDFDPDDVRDRAMRFCMVPPFAVRIVGAKRLNGKLQVQKAKSPARFSGRGFRGMV